MPRPFHVGDNVRTRDGREVRILMTDGGSGQPIIGAMRIKGSGAWKPAQWCQDGRYWGGGLESSADLLHVPETRTIAVVVRLMRDGMIIANAEGAYEEHGSEEFASQVVQITFEEGRHG